MTKVSGKAKEHIKKVKVKKAKTNNKEIKFLKNLYGDFKNTMTEVLGDTGEGLKKHKLLLGLAFLAFLYYRNKQFSIAQFVEKLESRIKKTARKESW